mmetsp:Transcript_9665/g.11004  ORF Transcript_9665/g.11004 Transcript_9665/m.11004 type:complete len:198 (-) Transcript_9665:684-1277(-)|eukprot:CAMPEP_0184022516 /NCGR_PEP_ID=MMETSP0954-20121128/10663_1 /TAXON_ID=627963 /ORGANISM="Aplanochytrium sp, Strain PBS07" /LENGTH=197 /DNA_ID=CAMNT_0026304927 /DNA_START=227 /DNA_END=820 /DNA_ORIENTATION=-
MGPGSTSILYFIPEDGDVESSPNVFSLSSSSPVSLGEIKKNFPLPGAYHFRFKKAFKNTYVWLDVNNDEDLAPVHDGVILSKVSRLSVNESVSIPKPVEPQPIAGVFSETSTVGTTKDLLGIDGSHSADSTIMKETGFANSAGDDIMGLNWDIPSTTPPLSMTPASTPPIYTPPPEQTSTSLKTGALNEMAKDFSLF